MLKTKKEFTIYVCLKPIDMRKSIDGLLVLVVEYLKGNPQSGDLFLFCNRARKKMKGIYWDKNGFMLLYKRLEKGAFKFPDNIAEGQISIGEKELQWLLSGFHFSEMSAYPELDFTDYF